MKLFLDSIINGVWVTDQENIIYYTNKGVEIIAGIPKEQIVGLRVLECPGHKGVWVFSF